MDINSDAEFMCHCQTWLGLVHECDIAREGNRSLNQVA
jgi:hypothetical protein